MKKFLKWAVIVVLVLGVIGAFLGEDDFEAELDYDISVDEEVVEITGETNLEDGTLIGYEIDNYQTTESMSEDEFFIDGDMEVNDGEFSAEIDISDEAVEGHLIEAWIGFIPGVQPDEIREEYGDGGEYLEGDLVDDDGRIYIRRI